MVLYTRLMKRMYIIIWVLLTGEQRLVICIDMTDAVGVVVSISEGSMTKQSLHDLDVAKLILEDAVLHEVCVVTSKQRFLRL